MPPKVLYACCLIIDDYILAWPLQVSSHPQSLPEHPALQGGGPSVPPLPMLLNFQQRFSQLLGLRRHCVVSVQLDGHGDLILSATASGKIALHDFAMFRASHDNVV